MEDIEYKDFDYVRVSGLIAKENGVWEKAEAESLIDAILEAVEAHNGQAALTFGFINEGEE